MHLEFFVRLVLCGPLLLRDPDDALWCLCVGTAVNEIVKRPFETESDSFYFVGNELIMHNKARYQ